MKKIKVGLIQQSNTADIRVNLMNLAKSIEACAAHGAQLIVLQELHNSLYFCQTENTNLFDLAEPIPGPSTGFYSELAAANKVVLVASLFEKRAPGLYHNTAIVFDRDGSIAGKSCLLRKVLFHPRRYRFRTDPDILRQTRSTGMLGSMVPGSCPSDGTKRG